MTLTYTLDVDWDGDGSLDGVNEASRLIKFACDRGKNDFISRSGNGFSPQQIGRFIGTFDNYDGRYNIWNADGALYGNLYPGRYAQLSVLHPTAEGSTDTSSNYIFTGYLVDIKQDGHNNTVNLIFEDEWTNLSKKPFFHTVGNDSTAAGSMFSYLDDYIYALAIDAGFTTDEVHVSTDSNYSGLKRLTWCSDDSYMDEIEQITNATLGRAYISADGDFYYIPISTTDSPVTTITESKIDKNYEITNPWDYDFDKVTFDYTIYAVCDFVAGTGGVYNNLTDATAIDPEGTYTFRDDWTGGAVDLDYAYALEEAWFYCSTSSSPSTANSIPSTDYSWSSKNEQVEVSIYNAGAQTKYFHDIAFRGWGVNIKETKPLTFETTNSNERLFKVDSKYYQSLYLTTIGSPTIRKPFVLTDGYGVDNGSLITNLNDVGNTILSYVSGAQNFIKLSMRGRHWEQFGYELENRVTITLDSVGISADYRIHKITHKTVNNCQDIETTFYFYPIMEWST